MQNLPIKRTHDIFYLNEKQSDNPKKSFQFITNEIKHNFDVQNNNLSLLDIGCATGEFIKYVSSIFSNMNFEGIDINQKLIDKAKTLNSTSKFHVGDVNNSDFSLPKKYDIITATGVLQIFDATEKQVATLYKQTETCWRFIDVLLGVRLFGYEHEAAPRRKMPRNDGGPTAVWGRPAQL